MLDTRADAILSMTPVQARQLFPGDAGAIARRFRELALAWHPDRNAAPEATRVFAHITVLHAAATKKPVLEERVFETIKGKQFRMRWRRRHAGPLGEILVGDSFIAHIVPADLDDLSLRAAAFRPRFADDAMRREMARFLPRIERVLETAGGWVFIERKHADEVLLADLAALGPVDPRHAAWMATRLVNLACWLQWSGVAHGAIGPDTLLVSPVQHSVVLTGPFLCAGSFGSAPTVLPERTLDVAPGYAATGARLDERLDPELLRLTLRELLGDPTGTRLAADPDFPKPFAGWLLAPAPSAQADFAVWERAREASFGPRRFVPWKVDIAAMMAA
jgi:hypothetical protein